jgi:DNA polymerase I-like protein with 3'-5' exonuclease and polymerase domains
MCLDPERVAETHAEYTELLGHVSKGLEELTGGINWRSTKQVGEFLYDKLGFAELRGRDGSPVRTAGGARLTDKASVEALRATTEEQRAFVSLRGRASKLASALSKNLNYFAGVCEHWNGIFRAEFNQTRTATHRISSSGITGPFGSCQLQNLPRAFKRLFTSRNPGWQVAESDGAQLEFRVAAYLGNDDQAKQDIRDPDFDIHSLSGSVIFNQPYDKFLAGVRAGVEKFKEWRTKAKKDTFKPLYGGQSGTASEKRWYATFRSRYSQLESTQKSWCNRVALKRMLKTSWGMRFYWPRAKLRRDGSLNVSASVYNYPVQCLATAEIIPIAVTYLWHRIAPISEQCFLVNTVHDSVVAELHPEVADTYTKIVSCSFSDDVYRYLKTVYNMDFDVELSSETKIGTHWGE